MKIHLREFKDQERRLDFDQSESWLKEAVTRLDETTQSGRVARKGLANDAPEGQISVEMELRRVSDLFEIKGSADASVELLCSRCASPYYYHVEPKFDVLYTKDRETAGLASLDPETGKKDGHTHGLAKNRDEDHDLDVLLSDPKGLDANVDVHYLTSDEIDLGDLVSEQIQIQIPFQPLCSPECKGICANCGSDLNHESCTCHEHKIPGPLAALKKFKISARQRPN